jgi:micrococcal nuclease
MALPHRFAALAIVLLSVATGGCALFLPRGEDRVPVVSWRKAARYVDEYVTVEGVIARTHNSGKACFLNFHPDWRRTFTAVIFANRFSAFPPKPEDHYRGKRVRVTGYVQKFEGRPEIILDSPDQIEILP